MPSQEDQVSYHRQRMTVVITRSYDGLNVKLITSELLKFLEGERFPQNIGFIYGGTLFILSLSVPLHGTYIPSV